MAKSSVRETLKSFIKPKAGATPRKSVTPERIAPGPGKPAVSRELGENLASQSNEHPAPRKSGSGQGGDTAQSAPPEATLDADESSDLSTCPPSERDLSEMGHLRLEIDDLHEAKTEARVRGLSRAETAADQDQIANRFVEAESKLVRAEGARITARSVTQLGPIGVPTKQVTKGSVGPKARLKRSGKSPRS